MIEKKLEYLSYGLTLIIKIYFDEESNKTKETYFDSKANKITDTYLYTYDSNKNNIELQELRGENNLYQRTTFVYDSNKNVKEENVYNSLNYLDFKHLYSYDEKNNVLSVSSEKILHGLEPTIVKTNSYSYDKIGNWIEKKELTQEGLFLTKREIRY